jgi:aspartate aminotransferase
MAGSAEFNGHSIKLAYGEDSPLIKDGKIAAVQTLSGTGACRLFGDFIHQYYPESGILLPVPTWSNHLGIFKDAGVKTTGVRYYDPKTKGLDFKGLIEDLKAAPEKSFVLFHACAHNPTGVDPSPEQWKEISEVVKQKQQYPLFDMAYQGFASGDTERDAESIRIFLADGHQIAVGQSFAKNMGLYGQRIGCLSVVTESPQETAAVRGQIQLVARKQYSNPPIHGALLVSKVLSDPALKQQWYKEVKGMADRIISMRHALRTNLEAAGSKLPWNHITDQIGMFCFTGITPEQVDRLTHDHHIYLTRNGRISIAGINTGNVERLAHALHEVTK